VALTVGFDSLADPDNIPPLVMAVVVFGSFVTTFVLMQWVARRVSSRFVLHGAVVGLAAFAVYIIPVLATGGEQPPMYWFAHAMKVLGGITGGLVAARRTERPTAAAV
jgi:uncharacterized membrane protein